MVIVVEYLIDGDYRIVSQPSGEGVGNGHEDLALREGLGELPKFRVIGVRGVPVGESKVVAQQSCSTRRSGTSELASDDEVRRYSLICPSTFGLRHTQLVVMMK